MKILFDTSALLSLFVIKHPNHQSMVDFFLDKSKAGDQLFIYNHSIAEFFRHITSGRRYLSYTPTQANKLLRKSVHENFSSVSLDTSDYFQIIQTMEKFSLHGAIVYDALIAKAADKIDANQIVTYNIQDFQRVWSLSSAELVEP